MQRLLQFLIIKCLFYQCLTGIEIILHRYGMNIAAEGTEQFFL